MRGRSPRWRIRQARVRPAIPPSTMSVLIRQSAFSAILSARVAVLIMDSRGSFSLGPPVAHRLACGHRVHLGPKLTGIYILTPERNMLSANPSPLSFIMEG